VLSIKSVSTRSPTLGVSRCFELLCSHSPCLPHLQEDVSYEERACEGGKFATVEVTDKPVDEALREAMPKIMKYVGGTNDKGERPRGQGMAMDTCDCLFQCHVQEVHSRKLGHQTTLISACQVKLYMVSVTQFFVLCKYRARCSPWLFVCLFVCF
jgi:hypothetical protein